MPSEYIPSSLFGRTDVDKQTSIVTSTVRKPLNRVSIILSRLNK
jgi:hypothetical protein